MQRKRRGDDEGDQPHLPEAGGALADLGGVATTLDLGLDPCLDHIGLETVTLDLGVLLGRIGIDKSRQPATAEPAPKQADDTGDHRRSSGLSFLNHHTDTQVPIAIAISMR